MAEPTRDEIIAEIMDAQADLQMGLGCTRIGMRDEFVPVPPDTIEHFLARSLARLHRLLENLDHPMYDPAKHPEVQYESAYDRLPDEAKL